MRHYRPFKITVIPDRYIDLFDLAWFEIRVFIPDFRIKPFKNYLFPQFNKIKLLEGDHDLVFNEISYNIMKQTELIANKIEEQWNSKS